METLLKGRVAASADGLLTLRLGKAAEGPELLAMGEARVGQTVLVGVRPEHVTLALQTGHSGSARNAFRGTVTKVIPRGPFFKVELDCGFFLAAFVTAQSLAELELLPGAPVAAAFKATAAHLVRSEGLDAEL
jgi:tungstate transport system ATP-binding protein